MSLGSCDKCHQPLQVSGKAVVCSRCGTPHPDHPVMKEWAAVAAKPKAPPAVVIPPRDFGHSVQERVDALEKTVKALERRLAELERRGGGGQQAKRTA